MTAVDSLPYRSEGWTQGRADGCSVCATQDTTTASRLGRRCAEHPPAFDPSTAVALMVDGWPDTALAYVRSFA